jgi:hypothetical protein
MFAFTFKLALYSCSCGSGNGNGSVRIGLRKISPKRTSFNIKIDYIVDPARFELATSAM